MARRPTPLQRFDESTTATGRGGADSPRQAGGDMSRAGNGAVASLRRALLDGGGGHVTLPDRAAAVGGRSPATPWLPMARAGGDVRAMVTAEDELRERQQAGA